MDLVGITSALASIAIGAVLGLWLAKREESRLRAEIDALMARIEALSGALARDETREDDHAQALNPNPLESGRR